ncbi:hypothetical protein L195_g045117, partial [Trifolium pratense]
MVKVKFSCLEIGLRYKKMVNEAIDIVAATASAMQIDFKKLTMI